MAGSVVRLRPPVGWRSARTTFAIVAVTVAAWLIAYAARLPDEMVVSAGFVPERLAGLPNDDLPIPAWITPLTSLLVHATFIHLFFNMVALVAFGRAVEPAIGRVGLLTLYIAGALAAAAGYYAIHAPYLPLIGAGGAVAAVLGAYAILFGRDRTGSGPKRPAPWLYALWLAAAWLSVALLVDFTYARQAAFYAVPAHAAGFIAGLLLARPLLLLRYRKA